MIITSEISDICQRLDYLSTKRRIQLIGIDGFDGVGKTTLGKQIASAVGGRLLSLDNFLEKNLGAYLPYLRFAEQRDGIALDNKKVILEGICLLAAAKLGELNIDALIYVRRIGKYGDWETEDIALAKRPAAELKRDATTMRSLIQSETVDDNAELQQVGGALGLEGELIDYHAEFRPIASADAIFEVREA
jgi:hypothetical protein